MERADAARDGTAEAVSRDQVLGRERRQGNTHFPCSADHLQDWQPYPVGPYSAEIAHHTYKWIYSALKLGVLEHANVTTPTGFGIPE